MWDHDVRTRVRVLVVEDDLDQAAMLADILADPSGVDFEVEFTRTLADTTDRLRSTSFDVLLLDLKLPDSAGLDTFQGVQEAAPNLAIIALTGLDDEALALQIIQSGAQDYLVKGEIDHDRFVRSIRYAVERKAGQQRLRDQEERALRAEAEAREAARQLAQRERELRSLERLTRQPPTSETARAFGQAPLRESAPDVFAALVDRYSELLSFAVEERAHRVDRRVSEQLRDLADQLGFLRAGPREVVEIHRRALQTSATDSGAPVGLGRVEVGRLLVLELMGYLVSYYRNFYVGVRRAESVG